MPTPDINRIHILHDFSNGKCKAWCNHFRRFSSITSLMSYKFQFRKYLLCTFDSSCISYMLSIQVQFFSHRFCYYFVDNHIMGSSYRHWQDDEWICNFIIHDITTQRIYAINAIMFIFHHYLTTTIKFRHILG